ncbi:MauE/DoxX family redox-associated membrane protein [Nocardioides zhouii]|nr:MauE/DoxX family redox-associated membrane protein [Nocardioides zhouii]
MTSSPVAALVVVLTLGAVLLVSGAAKLRDRRATQDAFIALRVPAVVPAGPSAAALPWVEIALAVLLLVTPARFSWAPAAVVLLLMLAYTALIARALTFDEPVTCSCFGSIGRHEVGPQTLGRNVLLSALAALVLWYAVDGGSAPGAMGELGAAGWWALLATASAVAVALLVAAPPSAVSSARSSASEVEVLDYERQPIPYGVLTHLNGNSATLAEAASTQARVLFFLNTHCGSCLRIAEKVDGWADRLDPAVGILVVYTDESAAAGQVGHRPDLATWEPELNAQRVLGLSGTPAAVLLGADGLLAGGPVTGEDNILELVEAVLEEVEAAGAPVEQ